MSMLKFMQFHDVIMSKVRLLEDTEICELDYTYNIELQIEGIYRFETYINLHKWSEIDSMKSCRLSCMILHDINKETGSEGMYVEIEDVDEKDWQLKSKILPFEVTNGYDEVVERIIKAVDRYVEELKDFK